MARKKRTIKPFSRKKTGSQLKKRTTEATLDGTPKITNDTVAEHREEVLSGARRLAYPLQQSRHKVVIVSILIIALVVIGSITYSILSLYRYKSTNNFTYRVSQIVPFPVARINGEFVEYEDYLFEIRHTLFYLRNHGQEGVDIDSDAGRELVLRVKQEALQKVKLDALALQIARDNNITVSREEVDAQIERVRNEGGVGESDRALDEVLQDFYDWDINDLRRTIYTQLVRQKIPSVVDSGTQERAERALNELKSGVGFRELVEKYSDNTTTKANKGTIGTIKRDTVGLPQEVVDEAFKLKEGEVSGLIKSPFGIDIIKIDKVEDDKVTLSHIFFEYFDIEEYLKEQLKSATVSEYISFPKE